MPQTSVKALSAPGILWFPGGSLGQSLDKEGLGVWGLTCLNPKPKRFGVQSLGLRFPTPCLNPLPDTAEAWTLIPKD